MPVGAATSSTARLKTSSKATFESSLTQHIRGSSSHSVYIVYKLSTTSLKQVECKSLVLERYLDLWRHLTAELHLTSEIHFLTSSDFFDMAPLGHRPKQSPSEEPL